MHFHYEEGLKYLSDYQSRMQIENHLLLKMIHCHLVPMIKTFQQSTATPCFVELKTTTTPSEVCHKPARLSIWETSQAAYAVPTEQNSNT